MIRQPPEIQSMMRGFQTYFIQQVIDVQPHIVIKDETRSPAPQAAQLALPDGAVSINGVKPVDRVRGIRAPGEKLAILEAIPGAAAAPILTGAALLRYGSRDVSIIVLTALGWSSPKRSRSCASR